MANRHVLLGKSLKTLDQHRKQNPGVIAGIATLCVSLVLLQLTLHAADSVATRKKELAKILASVWHPGTETENPGYYDPANQEALRVFISKCPGTEEALHAEVWLAFAEGITKKIDNPVEKKRAREQRAERMKEIAAKTANPATAKMALLVGVDQLGNARNWTEYEKQVTAILDNIKDYEAEADHSFLQFCKLNMIPHTELEPFYRRELIANDCYQDRLTDALAKAEELERKFPEWSKREGIAGVITQLRQGKSPYIKMPPR